MEVKSFETSTLKGWALLRQRLRENFIFLEEKWVHILTLCCPCSLVLQELFNSKKKFLVKGGSLSPTPCAFHEINHIRVNRSQWNIKQRETYTHRAPVLVSDSYFLQRSRCLVVSNGSSVAGIHLNLMLRYFFKVLLYILREIKFTSILKVTKRHASREQIKNRSSRS